METVGLAEKNPTHFLLGTSFPIAWAK